DSWHVIAGPGSGNWHGIEPVDSIAISASNPNIIYVTQPAVVQVSFDGGATWQPVPVPAPAEYFPKVIIDPTNDHVAYIVRGHFTTAPLTGHHVLKIDLNATTPVTDISGDLPNMPVHTILLDPQSGTLFVGTDAGVYASTDGGTTWNPYASGM